MRKQRYQVQMRRHGGGPWETFYQASNRKAASAMLRTMRRDTVDVRVKDSQRNGLVIFSSDGSRLHEAIAWEQKHPQSTAAGALNPYDGGA